MIDEPATQGDEYCAVLLAACDDALAAGEPSSILQSSEVPPELRRRLQRAMASVRLLRQSFQQRQSVAGTGAPLPWTTLGRFEIRRELGRGAYGIVYLAYDPQLRREVALKVPRPESIVTPELRHRFLREAQAAASLEHPNLVPVYEVGEVGPVCYLASAYCPGQTLAAWLKEQRELAPWRDAALLVATLADGVEHAHSRGILHRDLKPANILLQRSLATEATERRRERGEAIPSNSSVPSASSVANSFTTRITDFGLAKFLVDGEPEPTRSGAVLGTAAYMAPEQASGHSRQVGRQADVYALGVILYELLTGRPPFQADSMLETLEQVRTHEPVPPRRLRPRLPRDLETVCLRCLQKQPRERYQSAGELGEELRRFLRGEPIRARPVSAVNRAVRWCRRNPALAVASGMAALGMLCVLGMSIGWGIQQSRAAVRLREEVARAERAEQEAVGNAAKAREDEQKAQRSAEESRAVLGFFQDKVLAGARPKGQDGGLGRDATIRAAVEAAEPLIAKAFTGQPAVEAAIRHTMGNTYYYLGENKLAMARLERAVDRRRAQLGRDHPDTLNSMDDLADAYRAAALFDKAIALHQETLALRQATQGLGNERAHVTMTGLALAYRDAGRLTEAIPLLEQVLQHRKSKLGVDHEGTIRSVSNLAFAYRDAGRNADALALFEEAVKLWKVKVGPDNPDTLSSMNGLALAYLDGDRVSEAISLFEETVRLRKSRLGSDHLDTLQSMTNLGLAYREAGQIAKAISLQTETFRLCRDKLGPDHPYTLNCMGALAGAYWSAGQHPEAISLYEQQLKLRKTKLGPEHTATIAAMGQLAMAYQDAGRLAESVALQEQTFNFQKAKLGPDHDGTLATMDNLAEAYFYAGRITESLSLYEEGVRRMKAKLAPGHFCTLDTMRGLARVRMARREYAAAETVLAEAAGAADKRRADNPLEGARVRAIWGDCLVRQAKHREAEAILRDGLGAREPVDPKGWETAWTKSLLGGALLGQRKYADAEPLLVAGYNEMKEGETRIPIPDRPKLTEALDRVVQLYDAWGKKDKAERWRKTRPGNRVALP